MANKPVYLWIRVEEKIVKNPVTGEVVFAPKFPHRNQQVEILNEQAVYVRGMGGGFSLMAERIKDGYVYLYRQAATGRVFRISCKDFNRLLVKRFGVELAEKKHYYHKE